jgi:hypothetical protein
VAGTPMVIRARVRARLLGLRLLTLDAYITAASDGAVIPDVPPPARPAPPLPGQVIRSAGPADRAALPAAAEPGAAVARARELVEQGARTLDQQRRPS